MPHCLKGSALVGLLKGVRPRNAGHQHDGKYNDVFFAKPEEVSRPRQCTFEQATITQEVCSPDASASIRL
jgi:hypothetical protein